MLRRRLRGSKVSDHAPSRQYGDQPEDLYREVPDHAPSKRVGLKYRTIVVDPPWEIGEFPPNFGYENGKPVPYPTMTVEDIMRLSVNQLAAPEALLYLWTTAAFLDDAYDVARAWGFEPQYPLVWCKEPQGIGLGGKFVSNVEFVLFCRERHRAVEITSYLANQAKTAGVSTRALNKAMGTSDMAGWWLSKLPNRARVPTWQQWVDIKRLLGIGECPFDEDVRLVNESRGTNQRCETRWFAWPRGKHSQKPEHFYDLVEQVSPPPYVELFARRHRLGWDVWGDESANTAEWMEVARLDSDLTTDQTDRLQPPYEQLT